MNSLRIRFELVMVPVLWSLNGMWIKALPAMSAPTISFYRTLGAALFLIPFVGWRGFRWSWMLLASGLCYTAATAFFVIANKTGTAASAIYLQSGAPLYVFIAAVVWGGMKPDWRTTLSMMVGMTGIGILMWFSPSEGGSWIGTLCAWLSGVGFAGIIGCTRKLSHYHPAFLTMWNNAFAALVMLPFATDLVEVDARGLGITLGMGFFQLGLPYLLLSRCLKHVTSVEASLVILLEPALNPIWVLLAHGERPGPATWTGGACIVGALFVRYFRLWKSVRPDGLRPVE